MNARALLREATASLLSRKVPSARHDALQLLAAVLDTAPLNLLAALDSELSDEEQARFLALLERRKAREPLQYILGFAPFMGHEFIVEPGVLIPRQDSETLCMKAIELIRDGESALDLCCGSGCLGLSLKLEKPGAVVTLSDVSDTAIKVSRMNAERLNAKVSILQGDLFKPHQGMKYDLILSNPPYIAEPEMTELDPEVTWEPDLALSAGQDGLDFYRMIANEAADYLKPGGRLLLEIGHSQFDAVSALLDERFVAARLHKDLAGMPRVLETALKDGVH